MVCPAVVLVKLTVPLPWLNTPPLLDQLPPILIVPAAKVALAAKVREPLMLNAPGGVKLPAVRMRSLTVRVPVVFMPNVPAGLLTARLLKVKLDAVPIIAAAAPSKVTVPLPGVNVTPVACTQLPAMVMLAPAVNVPALKVSVPMISNVAGAVKLPVFWVRLLTVRLVSPLASNVPPDLLKATLLKIWLAVVPLIDCPVVPLNVTRMLPLPLTAVKLPLLAKLPPTCRLCAVAALPAVMSR